MRASEAEDGRFMRDCDCGREGEVEGEGEEVVVTGVEKAMVVRLPFAGLYREI